MRGIEAGVIAVTATAAVAVAVTSGLEGLVGHDQRSGDTDGFRVAVMKAHQA